MADDVRKVDDTAHLVAPILLAFDRDPFVRWMFPRSDDFLTHFGRITGVHGSLTAAHGGAYGRVDGRGAAFWYAPGVHPDPEILGPVFADAGITDKVSAVWERVAEFEPDAPYWYLRQIGIDPILQHGGHGSRLLAAGLHEIDASGGVAYLEATNGAARAFYERHRFTTLGEISANGSPPLWPMVRTPA